MWGTERLAKFINLVWCTLSVHRTLARAPGSFRGSLVLSCPPRLSRRVSPTHLLQTAGHRSQRCGDEGFMCRFDICCLRMSGLD